MMLTKTRKQNKSRIGCDRMFERHYLFINPAAIAFYVNAYREMWDSEGKEKKPRGKKGGEQ